ncbi:hypothetical protein BESB_080090 [Besnoitia besnoiti]|uniref:Clathrin/coatomer adaptor adaptin-like N-terminal domain-containing protein n=1 Tax=Besnoitia besnoiti TaxID=94643 RepID=A0A2A9MDN7_BESBE|nr:hypothetical protein BESB_080090 [Besnoitia besnoiti]PFH33793.1 hypothetical protein BESB_080090 [Besnoitia besnoiti]
MTPPTIRGVSLFLADVRSCPSSTHERARVLQELAKVRQRFMHPKKPLTGYEKKKCLTKLLYVHLLGYPVDFGHAEALSLLSSPHYSERAAAYLFCSLLLVDSETAGLALAELRRLCWTSIKKDISSQNEDFAALALDCASHATDRKAAADLFPQMQALANPSSSAPPLLRQKAYSCMLLFFRLEPSLMPCGVWAPRLGQALLFEQDVAVLLALTNLIVFAVSRTQSLHRWQQQLQLSVINTLARIISRDVPHAFVYHGAPAPWLAVRLLQLLQLFQVAREDARGDGDRAAAPDEDTVIEQQREAVVLALNEIVKNVFAQTFGPVEEEVLRAGSSSALRMRKTQSFSAFRASLAARLSSLSRFAKQPGAADGARRKSSGASKSGEGAAPAFEPPSAIQHAVLYEAVNLTIHLQAEGDRELRHSAAALLCSFIEEGNPNYRYKSLSLMAAMAADPDVQPELRNSIPSILRLLKEDDVSLRRQAVSLLFALSGPENWSEIVFALMESLERDAGSLQDEVTVQVAVLVETYAPDPTWLVDLTFKMLQYAPQHVRDETWVRVIQVVAGSSPADAEAEEKKGRKIETTATVNRPDPALQRYAAGRAAEFLEDAFLNETLLRLCAYLLGEFGHLIKGRVPGRRQVEALLFHFRRFSSSSAFLAPGHFPPFTFVPLSDDPPAASACPLLPLLLFALAKVAHAYPAEAAPVLKLLQELQDSRDLELQTRAVELAALFQLSDRQFVSQTLSLLPPFRRGQLLSRPLPPGALAGPGGGRRTRIGANRAAEERLAAHLKSSPLATRETFSASLGSFPPHSGGEASAPRAERRRRVFAAGKREAFEEEEEGSSISASHSEASSSSGTSGARRGRSSAADSDDDDGGAESARSSDRGPRRGVRAWRTRSSREASSDSQASSQTSADSSSQAENDAESGGSSEEDDETDGDDEGGRREEEMARKRQQQLLELLRSQPFPAAQTANPGAEHNRELWRRACLTSQGTLFLLPRFLEVFVHRKFDKKDGALLLEWRNLSPDKVLRLQRGGTQNVAGLLLKDEGFRQGDGGGAEDDTGGGFVAIPPMQKVVQRVRLRCMRPFAQAPMGCCLLCRSVQPEQQVQLPLTLPVVMTNFVLPATGVREGSVFLRYWKQLQTSREREEGREDGENKENVLTGPLALPPQHVVVFMGAGFNFHVIKVGKNLCGSGTFHTGTPAAGEASGAETRFVCASCMCMIELENPNADRLLARITVRAAHPLVSLYVSRLLGSYLLGWPPSVTSPPSPPSPAAPYPYAVHTAGAETAANILSNGADHVAPMPPGSHLAAHVGAAQSLTAGAPFLPSAARGAPPGVPPQYVASLSRVGSHF